MPGKQAPRGQGVAGGKEPASSGKAVHTVEKRMRLTESKPESLIGPLELQIVEPAARRGGVSFEGDLERVERADKEIPPASFAGRQLRSGVGESRAVAAGESENAVQPVDLRENVGILREPRRKPRPTGCRFLAFELPHPRAIDAFASGDRWISRASRICARRNPSLRRPEDISSAGVGPR